MRHPHRRRADGAGDGRGARGLLADLLLVDGDPLLDVRLLQDRTKLRLVMKGGVPYRSSALNRR